MNTDSVLPVAKRHLLLANAVVWGAPGVKVLVTGIQSYLYLWPSRSIGWLAVGSVLILFCFNWMFNRIVQRYSDRIRSYPKARKSLFAFLSVKGYVLVFFMICLGIGLKFLPGVPVAFFASFYSGLGLALIVAAARFLAAWLETRPTKA